MLSDPTGKLAIAAAVFVALYAAHQVADHWVQTSHQAAHKGLPGWTGRLACLGHVTTYTLTGVAFLAMLAGFTGWRPGALPLLAGLAISAVTHYIADRRTPLRRIAVLAGAADFHSLGVPRAGRDDNPSLGTGAYALDQSWHIGFLFLSALAIAA
ncbi:transcriptional regulator [Micromonospora sp. NPDC004704]